MTHRRRPAPIAPQRVVTAFVLPTLAASAAMAAVAGVSLSANTGSEATTTVSLASHTLVPHTVTAHPGRAARRALSRSADRSSIEAAPAGLDFSPCANDAVEAGLQPGAVRVHRAVCHAFPQIARYGGLGAGEHANGKAIDIMTTDPTLGYEIAAFLKAHAAELDLFDVIYRQHIWTPVRASEGWRMMPDRGSLTANHFDHVHVAVN